MTPVYSSYVPVRNGAATLPAVLAALRGQTIPPAELLVVDDGSSDGSDGIARAAGAEVHRFGQNRGRGAARAFAIDFLKFPLILCCDARNVPSPDFAARGLVHFAQAPRLAAVAGRLTQQPGGGVAQRWRARHLFLGRPGPVETRAPHSTGAAMVRRDAVVAVGNYRADLPAHEDSDLGERLRAACWEMWTDPTMTAECIVPNNLAEVFARYARWNEPRTRGWSWRDYPANLRTALRVHAPADLRERDWPAAFASLLLPHYLLACAPTARPDPMPR